MRDLLETEGTARVPRSSVEVGITNKDIEELVPEMYDLPHLRQLRRTEKRGIICGGFD